MQNNLIKVIKKGHPIFVKKMKVSELDKSKCSSKFIENNLSDDIEVYVKCTENGDIDFRGKKGEYRIVPLSAEIVTALNEPLYVVLSRDNGSFVYCTRDIEKAQKAKEKQTENEEMGGGRPSVYMLTTTLN